MSSTSLGFFGFMRSDQFTCPSLSAFTFDMLSLHDMAVDSWERPTSITVLPKWSKNNPFTVRTLVYIGATGQRLCPVTALLEYLAVRSDRPCSSWSYFKIDPHSPGGSLFLDEKFFSYVLSGNFFFLKKINVKYLFFIDYHTIAIKNFLVSYTICTCNVINYRVVEKLKWLNIVLFYLIF